MQFTGPACSFQKRLRSPPAADDVLVLGCPRRPATWRPKAPQLAMSLPCTRAGCCADRLYCSADPLLGAVCSQISLGGARERSLCPVPSGVRTANQCLTGWG